MNKANVYGFISHLGPSLVVLFLIACGGGTRQERCLQLVGTALEPPEVGASQPLVCDTPHSVEGSCRGTSFTVFSGPICEASCCAAAACFNDCVVDCAAEGLDAVSSLRPVPSLSASASQEGRVRGKDLANYGTCRVHMRNDIVIAARWDMES